MKKEIFFAILAGGTFGLLIAFGIWRANAAINKKADNPDNSSKTVKASPSPLSDSNFKVVLAKPNNQAVVTETPVIVSGLTRPNTTVVISGETADDIQNASDSGVFNSNVDLQGGANQINVSAFDPDGSEADTNLIVVYSGQFQVPTATESGAPIAYMGTVTDISNGIIQIKTATSDIQQVKASDSASFIDTRNNTTKTIKATDVAIGDYIIAMGLKDGNTILDSSRILVIDPFTKTTRRAFYGVVTDDSGVEKFIAKNVKTGETITVTPATGIVISGAEKSFGKISNNEKVIAVGEFKDGSLAARTIEVLK